MTTSIIRNRSVLSRLVGREAPKRGFSLFQNIIGRRDSGAEQQSHRQFTARDLLLPASERSGIRAFRVIAGHQVTRLASSHALTTNPIATQKNLPNLEYLLTKETLSEESQKMYQEILERGFADYRGLYLLPAHIQLGLKFENPAQTRESHMLLSSMTGVKMTADVVGVMVNINPEALLIRENNPNCKVLVTHQGASTLDFSSPDEMDELLKLYCMQTGKLIDPSDLEHKSKLAI